MDLNEYILQMTSDIQADAESSQISYEEAFLRNIAEKLIESEVITEYSPGFFKNKGRGLRVVSFNGYSFDDSDGTFNIFIIDDLNNIDESLTNSDLDSLIKKAEELVYSAIELKFLNWEESSIGYEAASKIYRLYKNKSNLEIDIDLKKIRIFVFTNKKMSSKIKSVKRESIKEVPVEFSVYDSTKLYEMAKAGFEKEPVDIDFSKYGIEGLETIKTVDVEEKFESYLTSIPGTVLAQIYLDYGSQILEGNVRSFLSVKGKINKGIRRTILEEPEKFFILNNGITVTGDGIECVRDGNKNYISTIRNLQIVNGGQTTASLANAVLKDKAKLDKINVMAKISILKENNLSEKLVPEISRASNSQNKVDEADFFSNHPYHIKIEELSKKVLAPATNGNQYQTAWFYERARGQYTVSQMKLSQAQSKAWQLKHPKNQLIKKTDLAKYIMSYEGYPQEVSKGSQAVMKKFSALIQGENGDGGIWNENPASINQEYFKELIAKAILFKEIEKLVSNQDWYKEVKAYRANIITYTIAILSLYAKRKNSSINLTKIWNKQHIYSELIEQCLVTTKEVFNFLTSNDRITQNVTEWAKKEECWKRAKTKDWKIKESFENSLVKVTNEKKGTVTMSLVESMKFVDNKPLEVWKRLIDWGKKTLYLNQKDQLSLEAAVNYLKYGKVPTDKQFSEIIKIYYSLTQKGFEE